MSLVPFKNLLLNIPLSMLASLSFANGATAPATIELPAELSAAIYGKFDVKEIVYPGSVGKSDSGESGLFCAGYPQDEGSIQYRCHIVGNKLQSKAAEAVFTILPASARLNSMTWVKGWNAITCGASPRSRGSTTYTCEVRAN